MNRFATTLLASALALILLCVPPIVFAQEPAPVGSGSSPAPSSETNPNGLPESPGATQSSNQQATSSASSAPSPTTRPQAGGAAAAPAV